MNQSRLESVIETAADISTGFVIAWAAWMIAIPAIWPELATSATVGGGVTVVFTVISVIRKYFWRRFFANDLHLLVHAVIKKYWRN